MRMGVFRLRGRKWLDTTCYVCSFSKALWIMISRNDARYPVLVLSFDMLEYSIESKEFVH